MDKKALAKSYPEEDIQTHTDNLLNRLESLKQLYPHLFANSELLYELLQLACIYHDLGKLYPKFQYCIKNRKPYIDGLPHGLLSLAFIDYKWLKKDKGFKNEDIQLLFQAVAYHHDRKMPYNNVDIDNEFIKLQRPHEHFQYDKLPTDFLADEINERYFTVGERFDKQDSERFYRFIMLEGLLNRLDYAASAHIEVEYANKFLPAAMEDLMKRWQEKDSKTHWNELQTYMSKNQNKNVIAIAQTGMGKTEAGLLWLGHSKGFFTLPLKNAINVIYGRIASNIVSEKVEERVGMLHSDTYIKYLERSEVEQRRIEGNCEFETEGISSDLYYNRTKQLSLPLTVCTLDQLFGFVFLYRGFEYKLATLSYSKIIIDEVQMYSSDLTAYLILGLIYITRMGGKFAILTATLPKFFIELLEEMKIPFEKPRVFIDNRIRHSIKVINQEINAQDIVEQVNWYKGKKILVICNTISSAVMLYHRLAWDKEKQHADVIISSSEINEGEDKLCNKQGVYLLHSYFINKNRAAKEKHIFQMGQKDSMESGIWIATQIVEASLDIDFDLLFTELSDLNGLFQRMGRCYRNRELNLPYNCFVFTGGKKLCSGVGKFIDKKIYLLSREALLEIDGVIDEKNKVDMVANLYTKEKLPEYYANIKDTIDYVNSHTPYQISKKEADKRFRNIDTVSIIPRGVYKNSKTEINSAIDVLKRDYSGMEREKVRELRESARKTIAMHTVDIARYLSDQMEITVLKISDNEQISIAECDYNSSEGVIRPALKDKTKGKDFYSRSF